MGARALELTLYGAGGASGRASPLGSWMVGASPSGSRTTITASSWRSMEASSSPMT